MQHEPPKPHHHGNLRNALIEAGIDLLKEGGLPNLTLRKCAALAGVSHAAPAHHFDGLDGLRQAIASEGFSRFRQAMLDASDQVSGAREKLRAIARGYLAFARAEPALYDLIFSYRSNHKLNADLNAGTSQAYSVLAEHCAPIVPPDTDPLVIETQVWSLCHGYALLILSGRFSDGEAPDDAVLALIDKIGLQSGT